MRKFRAFFLALAIGLSAPALAKDGYSILQGSTSDSETHITVMARTDENVRFQARINGQSSLMIPVEEKRFDYPESDYSIHRLKIAGLRPGIPYILEVIDSTGRVADRRGFKALDSHKLDGRVAVGSCMIRQMHNPFLWNNLERPENRPDVLLILGDIVYLDRAHLLWPHQPTTGLEIWQEYVKARLKENLYFWDELVPTFTVWDDHDAGGDNVDYSFPLRTEAWDIYNTFNPNAEIPGVIDFGPGMSRTFQLFGKNFVMLDGRSFREMSPFSPLFGQEQERFLFRSLKPGPNFILSGSQFYGGPIQKDSLEYNWPDIAKKWTRVLREHAEWKKATLAFVSGDVHFSEVQDLEPELFGYWTVEITASNIHSFGFPGHYKLKPNNPRRRAVTGTHNIVLLEFNQESNAFSFVTRAMGWRGNDLFKTVVSIAGPQPTREMGCEKLLQAAQ